MRFFAITAIAGMASALDATNHIKFQKFISTFGKSYTNVDEYSFRLAQFLKNDATIIEHNSSGSNFTLSHNKMSDWTQEEYERILTHVG
jgi:hypothetical protein